MQLLDLPDDVLILIFSHLYDKHALNVALASKRLAELALPRVAAVINCWKPSMLRRLHAYMLDDQNPRAQYLQHLTVEVHTFGEYDSDASDDASSVHSDDHTYYAANFSQANLLGDLLLRAQNICELSMERFQPCLLRDPRIGTALASMTRLANIRLSTLGDGALSILGSFASDLRRLTLSYYDDDDYPLEGETQTLPPLLSALAPFRHLQIVKLWNFTPSISWGDDFDPPQFPSITYLRLSDCTAPALDMVELCPNLSTLIYSTDFQEFIVAPVRPRAGRPWPPLKRLTLGEHEDIVSVVDRLSHVELLQISGELRVPSSNDSEDITRFIDLLRVTSLRELYLSVVVPNTPMAFLHTIPRVAPKLHVLELKVSTPEPHLEYAGWLDNLPEALHGLPIQSLRLYVPRLGYAGVQRFYPAEVEYDDADDKASRAEAHIMEKRRVESMRALPQRLVDAMPALRCLAILDEGPNEDNLEASSAEDEERVSGEGAEKEKVDGESDGSEADASETGAPVYEWDELRRTDWIRNHQWWRVVDGAEGRTLEATSVDEGDRLQQKILEQDPLGTVTESMHTLSV
ncbi:uncharacterized protein TRAVEDRAFT_72348 [Trametes versicolor FP-101664 SS1]|uniref:uncharacterized protein n=1 Tax=Trametes versicolor (strain FP-101664) TaxID=717944 RepID=UPI000462400F|nr:uncharacterized protein TRAVEDRAFT_72348 [Trametes versicolor FP-101664 SS1]EIW57158.1 hypothetical protein TRAVEDRAFT_72348 [Trametes versicolor FP-101664 SS1]